jgi:hypothetical protein
MLPTHHHTCLLVNHTSKQKQLLNMLGLCISNKHLPNSLAAAPVDRHASIVHDG